jgi:virginiamycin B lyase
LGTRKVGRLTTAGDVSEYTLPVNGAPLDITVGPDGNVWVTVPRAHAICQITPGGRASAFYLSAEVVPSFIAMGADRKLWFTEPNGKIGRFSVDGTLTEFSLTSKAAPGK